MQSQERLLYISRASRPLDDGALRALLGQAQVLNRRRDVTGALAFAQDHFLQVVEGRPEALAPLLASLARDARHDGLRVFYRVPTTRRRFSDWAMRPVHGGVAERAVALALQQPPLDEAAAEPLLALLAHDELPETELLGALG